MKKVIIALPLVIILLLATYRPATASVVAPEAALTVVNESVSAPWWYEEQLTVDLIGPCVVWELTVAGSKLVFYGVDAEKLTSAPTFYLSFSCSWSSEPSLSLWNLASSSRMFSPGEASLSILCEIKTPENTVRDLAKSVAESISKNAGIPLKLTYLGVTPPFYMGISLFWDYYYGDRFWIAQYDAPVSKETIARVASEYFASISRALSGLADIVGDEEDFRRFLLSQDALSLYFSFYYVNETLPVISVTIWGVQEEALVPSDRSYSFDLGFFGYVKTSVYASPRANSSEIDIRIHGADLEEWFPDEMFSSGTDWSGVLPLTLRLNRTKVAINPFVRYRLHFGPHLILLLTNDTLSVYNMGDSPAYDVDLWVEGYRYGMHAITVLHEHLDVLGTGVTNARSFTYHPIGPYTFKARAEYRDADPSVKDGYEVYTVYSNEYVPGLGVVPLFDISYPYAGNVEPGDDVSFFLEIRNLKNEAVRGLVLRDPLGRDYLLGDIPPWSSVRVNATLTMDYQLCGFDVLFSKPFKLCLGDEKAEITPWIHILPTRKPGVPLLRVEKSLSKEATWRTGDIIEVTITVTNEGPTPLPPIVPSPPVIPLMDAIPPGLEFAGSERTVRVSKGVEGTLLFFVDPAFSTIAPGSSVSVKYKVKVLSLADYTIPPAFCSYPTNVYGEPYYFYGSTITVVSNSPSLKYGLSTQEMVAIVAIAATIVAIALIVFWLRVRRRKLIQPAKVPPAPPA